MQIAGTSLRPLELWRPDVTLNDARNFASALAAIAVRAGSGARVTFAGPRPTDVIVLYERESCPYSRLVRETLSELDVDALIKPCPPGEAAHNRELRDVSGKGEVPFLIDRSTRVSLSDSARIIRYLTERYGSHAAPARLRGGPVSLLASRLASSIRGGQIHYGEPKRRPELPLELWNYEASPYCRIVRERLGGSLVARGGQGWIASVFVESKAGSRAGIKVWSEGLVKGQSNPIQPPGRRKVALQCIVPQRRCAGLACHVNFSG